MKYRTFIFALICFLLTSGFRLFKPQSIETQLTGTWYVARNDPLYIGGINGVSVYSADHSMSAISYKDRSCTTPKFSYRGTWEVQGKKLILKVTDCENKEMIGYSTEDIILSINSTHLVLKSTEDGRIQYRTKIDTRI